MDYNKDGKVHRYTNLDEILKLNIPEHLKEEFRDKFNKMVYFDVYGNCKIGKLIGIEVNEKLSELYFMIEYKGKKVFIPIQQSLTKL